MPKTHVSAEEREKLRREGKGFRRYAYSAATNGYARLGLSLHTRIGRLLDALEAAERERDEAREALPDPAKLEALADWLDIVDAERGRTGTEVQQDLRIWAAKARAVLGKENADD